MKCSFMWERETHGTFLCLTAKWEESFVIYVGSFSDCFFLALFGISCVCVCSCVCVAGTRCVCWGCVGCLCVVVCFCVGGVCVCVWQVDLSCLTTRHHILS